ncbi:VP1 [Gokushovirus WZ-2015a]|nr:VP1 [Gokushovirus WZ-2015a]
MSRNANSRFATNPVRLDMSRSKFPRNFSHKTTFNAGQVIPFYVDEVLPGDTFQVRTSKVVRMQTLLTPVMDNVYLDTYYFFVPNRLVWEHWKQFMGENTESAWIPQVEYEVPQLTAPANGWEVGTLADYMGIPTGVKGLSVSALPFRAYALIMNEWFRSENLTDPLNIPVDDATVQGVNTGNYVSDVAKGGKPFVANKFRDYFTSCLPSPQKGPDVTINTAQLGNAPVVPMNKPVPKDLLNYPYNVYIPNGNRDFEAGYHAGSVHSNGFGGAYWLPDTGNADLDPTIDNGVLGYPANLWAQFDNTVSVATINQLRTAFQIQKFYERSARGGSRYIETLKVHFGVTSPDARLQRPEYLGGNRIPVSINQVIQNSGTVSGSTPLGDTGAMSLTTDVHSDFTKSFVEHGFVIGVMVARYDHTYQQGIERFWSRKSMFDYYWPEFANIGEQAVLNKEIYAQGNAKDDEVFGYQEAWADYRYKPSRVSGEMRSSYAQSLDVWHLADDYSKMPALSDSWIHEDPTSINRVLAVSDNLANQFFCDIYVQNYSTRNMPLYSIPGLIDHH